ncbi:MAG TPA: flagellar FlbD family protein [Bryobacteraceae bacterium]|nr:flagellar FlbD family protein [Bryobacteraceae bacterium]
MITLTRLNHSQFVLNSDLVETIESTPDTVVTLTNSQKVVVKETPQEVVNRIIEFRRQLAIAPRTV